MGSCPITFLWLWPATDHEPHCRHVPINNIWRRTESTPRSGWWRSHMAGIYSDCSTREIIMINETDCSFPVKLRVVNWHCRTVCRLSHHINQQLHSTSAKNECVSDGQTQVHWHLFPAPWMLGGWVLCTSVQTWVERCRVHEECRWAHRHHHQYHCHNSSLRGAPYALSLPGHHAAPTTHTQTDLHHTTCPVSQLKPPRCSIRSIITWASHSTCHTHTHTHRRTCTTPRA